MLIKLLFEITAKLEPSWIESKYSLIADITNSTSKIASSSKVDRVNCRFFKVGIASTLSAT